MSFQKIRILLCLLSLTLLSTNFEEHALAAKKPAAKLKATAFVSSAQGSLQVKLTTAGKTTTKKIKPGAVRLLTFSKGTKIEFSAKPKAGFKAGIIVNGELVKFQKEKAKAVLQQAKTKVTKVTELKYTLPKVSISASLTPVIEVRFVAKGQPFAKNAGVTFSGLGGSIKVTNQSTVNLSGKAECDVGVASVSLQNLTTNTSGGVSGTKSWLSPITFAEGDNKIAVQLHAKDGSTFTNNTVITYFPGIDFVTALNVSNDVLFVGPAQNLIFNIGLSSPAGAIVTLVETDKDGVALPASTPSSLADTGVLPDEIDEDGVFTGSRSVDSTNVGFKYFRAKVEKPSATYFSEVVTIWITNPFSSAQVKAAVDLANNVQARFDALKASGQTEAQAVATILAEIQLLPVVGAAGVSDGNAIWWMTSDGILGGFHPFRDGERGGGRGAPSKTSFEQLTRSLEGNSRSPALVSFYTPRDLDYVVSEARFASYQTLPALSEDPNRVKSYKALLISPFIANPNSGANFGNTDDFYGPWQVITSKGSICSEKAEKFVSNNGSIGVAMADFENLSDFGVIHFSTHGNNFYNGLLSLWKDVWGKQLNSLQAYFSIVGLNSGVYLPVASDGTIDSSSVATDLAAHRIAIFPTGAIYLLPEFFQHYVGGLPRSIVLLSACRSTYNNSMADVFLGKGAGAVYGFTDYVNSGYAKNITTQIYTRLLDNDDTVSDAFTSAVTQFGTNDNDADPAYLTLAGNNDLKRHSGDLANAGFEDGVLTPWQKDGDGRIIGQLGNFTPPEGSFMGIVSTGLGFTTTSGTLSQSFCLQNTPVQNLQFAWNYSSEEFKEYCNSQFQDTFSVQLCEVDPNTEAELSCNTLLYQTVDDLCGMVFGVSFGFDQGGVFSTGWLNATLPVPASLAGKSAKLKFSAGDVGDSIYDTAVLIDDIKVSTPAPSGP